MKIALLLFLLVMKTALCGAQSVISSRSYGGSESESNAVTLLTSDGGSISVGRTESLNGNVSGNHGSYDAWVVKLDATGTLVWQKCFGGTQTDYATAVVQTSDSGYVVTGYTNSVNGDFADNHGSYDAFAIRLDAAGNTLWKKCYGNTYNQYSRDIAPAMDGGFVLVGYGNVSYTSYTKNWCTKISATGVQDWTYTELGVSAQTSSIISIQPTADSGFICAGDAVVSSQDGHLIKLRANGTVQWAKNYGASSGVSENEFFYAVKKTPDGNYLVTGSAFNPADKPLQPGHSGQYDYWVVKTDAAGNVIWKKFFGGSKNEYGMAAIPAADGGYLVIGSAESSDSLASGVRGASDAWLLKLSATGNLEWQRTYGGPGYDFGATIAAISADELLLSGGSGLVGDHITSNNGSGDFWLWKVKLHPLPDVVMNTYAIPATISTGGNFTAQFSISNLGPGPADPTKVSFYLSADSLFTPGKNGDTLIGVSQVTPVINAGTSSASASYNVFMPCMYNAGNYYLAVVADGPRELPETNETNNAVILPFTLVIGLNNPIPIIASNQSSDSVCTSTQIQLTVTNSGACSSCSYSWNTIATGTTINVTSTSSGTYRYVVGVTNSCGYRTATKMIYYATVPTLDATASPATVCVGDSVSLTATGAATYNWVGRGLAATTGSTVRAGTMAAGSTVYTVAGSNQWCIRSKAVTIQANTCTANIVYTFTGNGNWNVAANWQNNLVPPNVVPNGSEVIINPAGQGECVVNGNVTFAPGAKLTLLPGKKCRVASNVTFL